MTGVEIDFVVTDSLAALELYERIFEVERVEVTSFPKGQNEAVFTIYNVRFHMLDENPEFGLTAPGTGSSNSMWFNVMVPDIKKVYETALEAGCTEVQPITEMMDYGVSNAMFSDPFGYVWMLHQIYREVSFEERIQLWEEREGKNNE